MSKPVADERSVTLDKPWMLTQMIEGALNEVINAHTVTGNIELVTVAQHLGLALEEFMRYRRHRPKSRA